MTLAEPDRNALNNRYHRRFGKLLELLSLLTTQRAFGIVHHGCQQRSLTLISSLENYIPYVHDATVTQIVTLQQ